MYLHCVYDGWDGISLIYLKRVGNSFIELLYMLTPPQKLEVHLHPYPLQRTIEPPFQSLTHCNDIRTDQNLDYYLLQ